MKRGRGGGGKERRGKKGRLALLSPH